MLCMNNPWDKEVRRLSYDTRLLPTVQPPTAPEPFALMLDNGTHCLYISGGAPDVLATTDTFLSTLAEQI